MSKDTFYFSHDYAARNDEKMKILLRKHGMRGYGIYWAIIEELYHNANALRTDCDGIAYDLREDSEVIKSVIYDFDLFFFDGDNFGSYSVKRRIDERKSKSLKASESAQKRWSNANAMRTHSDRNAIKERKGKESKVNSMKKNVQKKVFTPPTLDEVAKYCADRNNSVSPQRFIDFYGMKGWMVGKNKMKDWKAAVRTWEDRDSQKTNRSSLNTKGLPEIDSSKMTRDELMNL